MTCLRDKFFAIRNWIIICAVGFFAIPSLGTYWVNNGVGYEKGNRRRFIAVLKMECLSILFSLFIYNQLLDYYNKKEFNNLDKYVKDRQMASTTLIIFLIASQMAHFLYFAPDTIQEFGSIFLDLSQDFFLLNTFVHVLNAVSRTKHIVTKISEISFISPLIFDRRCQVQEITIPIKKFSGDGGTVRLALVSDLHVGPGVHREQVARVVDTLLKLDVNAVAFVGDMVDGPAESLADRLMPIWPLRYRFTCFFVTGNHEYYYGDAKKWLIFYEDHGIHVLDNRAKMFHNICIVGVNDISSEYSGIKNHEMNLSEAMRYCTSDTTRVLLAHNPASVRSFPKKDLDRIDVVLSGHTHAGQYYVIVPVVFWILPYYHGLYDLGHGKLLYRLELYTRVLR
ncbi:hypothetical protein KIN20_019858 [Parelaphostrongylus tenuis]|uniref:Calcineurin-like phosphoesterase domain-containing protein n=1 Tax=Parelaphostrongylus tenuis TaxID=148309 RepID=A0AAD5QQG3_PARTN|nr:hypothetical protein KIN20_019858 [Parelaphostrongylus tenuis]